MTVYLCFIIPAITVLVLFFFFKHKTVWWEFTIPIAISVIFILIAKWISINSLTSDTEWLGGYVTEVRYYEAWNERVSCRHPIYCTSCSGSGKSRSCRTYVCGHHHAYDVDYHPEYWTAETTLSSFNISKQRYNELARKFGTPRLFVDLNRNYHTIDGDMYKYQWGGENERLEPVVVSEQYENRPKAARSVFSFQELDSIDIKTYKPFDYPNVYNQFHQDVILGYTDPAAEHKLQVLNSRLGRPKQVRVFILVFKNQPLEAGHIQERYWEGSNKNEFVITIGINDQNEVQWSYDFSWTEVEETKVETRDFINSQKQLDLSSIVDFTYQEIETKWIRKDFKKFEYLTIQPTMTQTFWIFFLTILINTGLGFWIVLNDVDDESERKRIDYKNLFKRYRRY